MTSSTATGMRGAAGGRQPPAAKPAFQTTTLCYLLVASYYPMEVGFPHRAERYRPGDHRFRPGGVGIEHIWKEVWPGDDTPSSPGEVKPRFCPERQFSLRTGFMRPRQSVISHGPTLERVGWTVPTGPSPAEGCFFMAGGLVSG